MSRVLDSPELIANIARSAKVVAERTAKAVAFSAPKPPYIRGESGAIVDSAGNIIAPPKPVKK